MMMVLQAPQGSDAASLWVFAFFGVVALTWGVLFLIWPRKSGEIARKMQQRLQPYWTIPRFPIGVSIALGCLGLIVAFAMFYAAWSIVVL